MTQIVFLSDTHCLHDDVDVPGGDILVHAGDGLNSGSEADFWRFSRWFNDLPHEHKIFVPGNHDGFFQTNLSLCRTAMPGTHILVDESITIEGIKFYGSPWTPTFFDWYWMQDEEDLPPYWDNIPDNTDILVTHGPPADILDLSAELHSCGSPSLLAALHRVKPKIHVFGHIHEGYGEYEDDDTLFLNVSICTRSYKPTNDPITVDWSERYG